MVVGLCETWLSPSISPSFPGFTIVRKDRPQHRGGGLALLIHNSISYNTLQIQPFQNGALEVLAVQLGLSSGWCTVMVLYNPCADITANEFNHYFNILSSPSLIMGDFNARHTFWDPSLHRSSINSTGKSLFNCLISSPTFSLLNTPGVHTRFNSFSGNSSTLDLCLGSGFFQNSNIEIGPYMGSDHLPLLLNCSNIPPVMPNSTRPRWKFSPEKWPPFMHSLKQMPPPTSSILDDKINTFSDTLLDCGKKHFHFSSGTFGFKPSCPWWNNVCSDAIKKKRRAFNILKRFPNNKNKINFRKLEAKSKRIVFIAKRKAWSSHCSTLSFSSSSSITWAFFRKMIGKYTPAHFPLTKNGTVLLGDILIAEEFASHYKIILSTPRLLPDSSHHSVNLNSSLRQISQTELSSPFTFKEFSLALHSLHKGKAIGSDYIPNDFLLSLPLNIQNHLLSLYNQSWTEGQYPSSWKHSILLPFHKPGKDPTLPSSYRPISLLSCVGKLMEKMVHRRLSWWLESHLKLPASQCGFRPGRSTQDVLIQLEHLIQTNFKDKGVLMVAFMDIQGAFDRASHLGILTKLSDLGIGGTPLLWVKSFLSSRTFSVSIGNTLSSPHPILSGVPQGSVLSPLLFSILLSDIPTLTNASLLTYADDISIVSSSPSLLITQQQLQSALNNFKQWTDRWGLDINAHKTKFMCFTRKRINILPTLKLDSIQLILSTTHCFLGLIFDGPILTWKHHIAYLRTSCAKRLNILKRLAGVRWGASRTTLLHFYSTYIQSKLDYGSVIYGSASSSILKPLDTISNTAIRIALGAFCSSPIPSLFAESGILPLSFRRQSFLCKNLFKISTMLPKQHPTLKLLSQYWQPNIQQTWSSSSHQPFIIRAFFTYSLLSIPPPKLSPITPVTPLPPWFPTSTFISASFSSSWSKNKGSELAYPLFLEMVQVKFESYIQIFTDGSLFPSPPSTSCAIYIPHIPITFQWKLHSQHTIVAAELFAIYQALLFTQCNLKSQSVVIFTDSLSSLHLISNPNPTAFRPICFLIQSILISIYFKPEWKVHLQWIPSHVGIKGNEAADAAAKAAHSITSYAPFPLDLSEMKKIISKNIRSSWDSELEFYLRHAQLGLFRNNSAPAPWVQSRDRQLDTTLTRLRIGHTGLNSHLHRLNLKDSPFCPWCPNAEDTISHFLFQCPRFHSHRTILSHRLRILQVTTFDLPTLLDGHGFPIPMRHRIISLFHRFLKASNQLHRI